MDTPDIYINTTGQGWQQALDYCLENDVEKGGCFDVRMMAINLWSHPWSTSSEDRCKSQLLASFYPEFVR